MRQAKDQKVQDSEEKKCITSWINHALDQEPPSPGWKPPPQSLIIGWEFPCSPLPIGYLRF
jgi:hypothetical protein